MPSLASAAQKEATHAHTNLAILRPLALQLTDNRRGCICRVRSRLPPRRLARPPASNTGMRLHERRFRWYSRSLPFCRLNARQRRCGGYYGMCNLSGECIADLRETWHSTYRTEHARPDARLLPVLPKRLVMVAFWTQCLWWYGTLYRKTVRNGAR